jgi:uncharacterized MAPEG superfamily protein
MGVFAGSTEIQMLCWAIVLGLVQLVIATTMATIEQGLPYNISARDEAAPSVGKMTARMVRGFRNFLETFPFFAAAVIIVSLLNKENQTSALGAQFYFWARLAYVPAYAIGVPFLRTAIWTVSIVGLVMVLIAAAS